MVGMGETFEQYLIFLGVLALLCVIGSALGILIGTRVKDAQEAQAIIIPVYFPMMLFSGFFLPYKQIPFFFKVSKSTKRFEYWLNRFVRCLNLEPSISDSTRTLRFLGLALLFRQWMYEISFLRYAFGILKTNQWTAVKFSDCDVSLHSATCYSNGEQYLEATNASSITMPQGFGILLAFVFGIAFFSFISMRSAIAARS